MSLPGGTYLFHSPLWLLALGLIPLVLWLRGRRNLPVLLVPFAASWHRPGLLRFSRWPTIMAAAGAVLLVLALARPQRINDRREVRAQGYDLVLAIDLSTSMLAEDFSRGGRSINRLDAIKPVIQAFIERRPNDRIGVVLFSGRAYTMAPLTFDHDWLSRQLERMRVGVIEDGTAIGDGLGVALGRLEQARRETAGGKRIGAFIILLTDGSNNRGTLQPEQAAEIAKSRRIPIYTMIAGRDGFVKMPVGKDADGNTLYQTQATRVDEGLLRAIAGETGGRFFRAGDVDTIEAAFAAIDSAQKIEFQARSHVLATELFPWFAIPGGLLILAATALLPRSRA